MGKYVRGSRQSLFLTHPPPLSAMASMLTPENFITAFKFIFGGYGLQMLLMPAKMVTDHFDAPATPLLNFWIRGESVSILGMSYALHLLPTEQALPLATAVTIAVAVLYPYNAKLNLIGDKLPVKYPMHYVPEVLMGVLSIVGAYLVATN